MPSLLSITYVALGGALGSVSRYLLGTWAQTASKSIDFPYGTLTVDLTGCFVIGFLSQLAETRGSFTSESLDTVWPKGTLAVMPLRQEGGKLFGPGVYDMKAGTAILLTALKVLKEAGLSPRHPLRMLFTSDEEVRSITSRDLIEAEARLSGLAIVLEPALAGGQIKTFRKGVGDFTVAAHGRAAHAGGDHQKGVNAIEELSYHIQALQKLTDYESGTTINVGIVKGGSASNVVPERAEMEVDFRVSQMAETIG